MKAAVCAFIVIINYMYMHLSYIHYFLLFFSSFLSNVKEAANQQQKMKQETEDCQRIIDLLKQKVRLLQSHAVELETQMEQYSSIAPVLDELMNKFHFSSPEAVVNTVDKLQKKEIELFSQLTASHMEVANLEAKV